MNATAVLGESAMSRLLVDVIEEVGERISRAPHLLLCLDFDGTLSRIVDDPVTADLSPAVQPALLSLAGHPRVTVACISGRDRADLQARVGIPGVIYAGNHGLEISGPGCLFVEPTAASSAGGLKELAGELVRRLQHIPGTLVEDKGLTLSIHYRQVAPEDCEEVRRILHAALANANHPFQLTGGDKVHEVRPRVYWHKGTAVHWIREHLAKPEVLVVYIGDDVTDEDAFTALQDEITIKVGMVADSAARYALEGPDDVEEFLDWLADAWRERR